MTQQIPIAAAAVAAGSNADGTLAAAADIAYLRLLLVNVVFVGVPGSSDWVLVDTGLHGRSGQIRSAAARRFGADTPPRCIVLTHGHFDHVGGRDLAEAWDVPVYAHPLERPYLDGSAHYPPPDPGVGGGAVSRLSALFPTAPVDLRPRLRDLPADGTLAGMPGWRWLHTPGHSVGHVSLWREADRSLIAGDAVVTTASESAYAEAVQAPEIHGPPRYLTHDWQAARQSAASIAALAPELLVTGHGRALRGGAMRDGLRLLADRFDEIALPPRGRYLDDPQRADDGTAYRPA